MASFNKVIFMGNLTRDPEVRFTEGGLAVCNFDIAVNSNYKGKDNEEPLFMRVVTFNKQAENCGQYLKKGKPVFVEGRLSISKWKSEDGQERQRPETIAQVVQFLGGAGEISSDVSKRSSVEARQDMKKSNSVDDIADDEIPF
jgi:single-strand DNA-binding protein